jgi:hypothetical protein
VRLLPSEQTRVQLEALKLFCEGSLVLCEPYGHEDRCIVFRADGGRLWRSERDNWQEVGWSAAIEEIVGLAADGYDFFAPR